MKKKRKKEERFAALVFMYTSTTSRRVRKPLVKRAATACQKATESFTKVKGEMVRCLGFLSIGTGETRGQFCYVSVVSHPLYRAE